MNQGWRKIWHTQKVAQMRHTHMGRTNTFLCLAGERQQKNAYKMRYWEIKANNATQQSPSVRASNYVDEREFVFCSHYVSLRPAELSSAGVTAPQ